MKKILLDVNKFKTNAMQIIQFCSSFPSSALWPLEKKTDPVPLYVPKSLWAVLFYFFLSQ